jgi:hypothetical protein
MHHFALRSAILHYIILHYAILQYVVLHPFGCELPKHQHLESLPNHPPMDYHLMKQTHPL